MGGSELLVGDAHRFAPAGPDEEYVYGSCAPGWHSAGNHDRALTEWVSYVQSQDIERVCCLLTGRQLDAEDANVGMYRNAFGEDDVCHAPIPDGRLADRQLLSETILPFVEESVEQESPVVIHGLSGIGRTGQVLAAWLVWGREYEPERAIDTVKQSGRDPMEVVEQSTPTEEELFSLLSALETS